MTVNTIPFGTGILCDMDGDIARFRIDLLGDYGRTPKGFRRVATSSGNKPVPGKGRGLLCGINCYDRAADRTLTAGDFPDDWSNEFFGRNVAAHIEGGTLVLEVDTSKDFGETTSGKSVQIASTGGNQMLPAGLEIGLNMYDPIPKAQWSDETRKRDAEAKAERAEKAAEKARKAAEEAARELGKTA